MSQLAHTMYVPKSQWLFLIFINKILIVLRALKLRRSCNGFEGIPTRKFQSLKPLLYQMNLLDWHYFLNIYHYKIPFSIAYQFDSSIYSLICFNQSHPTLRYSKYTVSEWLIELIQSLRWAITFSRFKWTKLTLNPDVHLFFYVKPCTHLIPGVSLCCVRTKKDDPVLLWTRFESKKS